MFVVRSYYGVLHTPREICFPWGGIWCARTLNQVAFFVWTSTWEKILTNDNLRKIGIILVDYCWLCRCSGKTGKTVDHLILHCGFAYVMWSYVFGLFGVHWVMSHRLIDLLVGWRNWFGKCSSVMWNLATLCLYGSLLL